MTQPIRPAHDTPLDDELIGQLAAATPPEPPAPEVASRIRDTLFRRIHADAPDFRFVHRHEGEWTTLLRGVERKLLHEAAGAHSYLLRLAPGARVPRHSHALDEESLILEGDLTIDGVLCTAGDYHFAPCGKPHGRLTSEHGCLLFVRGASDNRVAR